MRNLDSIIRKPAILLRSLYGYCIKWLYNLHILRIRNLHSGQTADVIVSLTSYGRRVSSCVVCYSIYSILNQSIQPKRILLWLSEDEWNDNNLPKAVRQLKSYGVEIHYCKDMSSYKKLFPTLQLCPDDDIVTIDDDILYPRTLLSRLLKAHNQYPDAIIVPYLRKPVIHGNKFASYVDWKYDTPEQPSLYHFPLGGSGCWYPKHSLKSEMVDYSLANRLCPTADDVWFWASGIAAGTMKYSIGKFYNLISFDAIYQFFHSGSALQHTNVKGRSGLTNDEQINSVLDYLYNHYAITLL